MAVFTAVAQERKVEHNLIVDIPFHFAKGGEGDIHYGLDSTALTKSLNTLESLNCDTLAKVKKVNFYSSVSPEGTIEQNSRLSKIRIATAEKIVRSRLNIADSVAISYDERYVPWEEYLIPTIKADNSVPRREELLALMQRNPNDSSRDDRTYKLLRTDNGKLWDIVKNRYFDHIRKGGAIITVERSIYDELTGKNDIFNCAIDSSMLSAKEPEVETTPRSAISIKTNAAAVAALIANIGFEVKLAPRWSLDIMGAYSPYNLFAQNRKIRLFGVRPEVRFWWGEAMKRGHFLGLHGFTSAFNVQINDKARFQDPNHALWGVGLAYGYALPLGKKENWGVEFTLGVGYARIKYDKYDGAINGQFIERKLVNYYGPTRLGVNFSYRFDIEGKKRQKR